MALSTQKERSFYAFAPSNKHLRPLRGHVAESKYIDIGREGKLERVRKGK